MVQHLRSMAKNKKLKEACRAMVLENTKLAEAYLRLNPPVGHSFVNNERTDCVPGKSDRQTREKPIPVTPPARKILRIV